MDLWPARLKIQWSDVGDGAYRECIESPEEDVTGRQMANNAAARLIAVAANDTANLHGFVFDNWVFELDNTDPSVIRFRGSEHIIAHLRDIAVGTQEFRVLSNDETCEMDGTNEDAYGGEHYWHCENLAVQTAIDRNGNVISVCRNHEEEYGY